jgi:uncharacterized cupredoxin-like copper-binding protein
VKLPQFALAGAMVITIAACGAGTSPTAGPTATLQAPTSTPGAQRIEVALTDQLRIEPATMTVTAGQPVTFVVTNTGATDHEFYLGDEAAQAEHEAEMAAMGGMVHDEPNGIAVAPGATKELTFVFPSAGEWIAGCHFPGHYPAGMRATITINP